jgi:hypothetical protein
MLINRPLASLARQTQTDTDIFSGQFGKTKKILSACVCVGLRLIYLVGLVNSFLRAPHPPKRGRNGGEMEYFYDELTRPYRITIPWVDKYICTKKSDCSLLALNGAN